MTIFVIILALSACASALLSWALGTGAIWWICLRALLLFCGAFVALTLLYFLSLFIIASLVDQRKPVTRVHHGFRKVTAETMRFILLLGRIRVHTEGVEKVDRTKPFLLIANHRSNFDPFAAMQAFKGTELVYICKPAIFKIPVAGGFAHMSGFLSINREDNREGLKTILRAIDILKEERTSVAVYPEGTRNKTDADLLPFRAGAFSMAKRANVPIVVAVNRNTEHALKHFIWRRTDVSFKVLDVIEPEQFASLSTQDLAERVRKELEAELTR